jgi:alkylation response protein AidB-like acyl-CoA dehydrogenase
MDFDLSPDQEALRDAARALLGDACTPTRIEAVTSSRGHDAALWDQMTEQGWTSIMVPEASGGVGLGVVEAMLLATEAGFYVAPVPLVGQMHALCVLDETVWAEPLISGELIATVCAGMLTRHDDGSVSGTPEPVIFGATADLLVAPTEGGLVVVDLRHMERSDEPAMDQTRELAWITLDRTQCVDISTSITTQRFGDLGALFSAAGMLGAAEAAMTAAVAYATERHQFDRPIGSFQAVKHRCADMLVDVEAMRSAVHYAAWALQVDDPEASIATSTAKTWCADAGIRVIESSLQVHGGIGFTWESPIHRYLKRAQLDQVSFGDATEHRRRIAAHLRNGLDT